MQDSSDFRFPRFHLPRVINLQLPAKVLRNLVAKHLDGQGDKLGIEVASRTAPNFLRSFPEGDPRVIRALVDHCVHCVDDSKDSCTQGNALSPQAARIAATVELLVMG